MDRAAARFLISTAGRRLLDRAREVREIPAHRRSSALAGEGTPAQVRAALGQDDLRRRAAARCPHAESWLFTREALEQATAWPVAADRANRWPAPTPVPLHDLGAGVGFDALATAATGRPVVAWERDPVRALLLRHNAVALELGHLVEVREADAAAARPSGALAFLDPDRRPGGRRTRDPDAFDPPRAEWDDLLAAFGAAMVKLPPAGRGAEPPLEVVSLDRRVRECRIHLGAFPGLPPRRATSLPSGAHVEGEGRAWPPARAVEEGDWLLDPDPAVTVAGLVGDLATDRGFRPIHPRIAYLLADTEPEPGAPGRWVRVEALLPVRRAALNAWLASQRIGQLTIRARGIADSVQTWRKRLRPRGPEAGTLVFTRDVRDRWVVLAGRDA